jgi:hypothetical protein
MAGGGNSGAGLLGLLLLGVLPLLAAGEDPYRFFTWTVTSGDIYPLGVKQKVGPPTRTLLLGADSISVFADAAGILVSIARAGDPDQQPVPGAADRCRHQRQPRHQRLQQTHRAIPPLLVSSTALATMDGISFVRSPRLAAPPTELKCSLVQFAR